jgi:predicted nucleic acid-binding protein
MSGRFFLDTNIFAYSFDAKSPAKARRAAQLIRQAADTGNGVVSYQVVQEFFNLAFRRFQHPMNVAEAEQYLITVFRPLLAVHSSQALFVEAMRIAARHHFAWYDCLIVAAALQSQCGVLYSEDLQHGQEIERLVIENPFR